MKILAYQPLIEQVKTAVDRRAHVRRMAQVLEPKCRQEADAGLILLPELATISYSAEAFANLGELAEPWEGETFATMASLAERTGWAVCYGFPRMENGRYHISQTVISPSGQRLADYDKLHLAQFGASMEQNYFTRGDKLAVFEWGGIRFGVIICYDFRFSDLIKRLVETYRVDAILHPVAFAKDETYASWHHFVITRALERQVYFLSVNQAGSMWGHSILCPPWIDGEIMPLVMGEGEEAHLFTLDKRSVRSAREIYPFRMDRLADYSILGE
ncbi:MAG: carbon-nitrogen hydrolase family protein [Chloroflexi bacterium]|nr:carbon-nitrogen hydrolase family protein [Chloroflexota bacterium]